MFWTPEYVVEHVSALVLAVVLLAAARVWPRVGRALYVALFAWACIVNWQTALERPHAYLDYADFAVLDLYRDFIRGFFAAHILAIVGTIATCQGLIAAALFAGGKPARLALVGATVFLVMIAPLGAGSGFPSTLIMAAGCISLLLSPRTLARSAPAQLADALVARRAARRWRPPMRGVRP
jgi:hypothetical protein